MRDPAPPSLLDDLLDELTPPVPAAAPAVVPEARIVYQSARATLWHGRAEDVVPTLDSESVDLIVTDPPYGVENVSNRRRESFGQIDNDRPSDRLLVRSVLAESVRLLRQHRHLYVFGPPDALDGLKVSEVVDLVWDKGTMGSGDVRGPWGPSHERINFAAGKHRHAGKAGLPVLPARLRKSTVLRYNRPTGRKVRHPNEKPVALCRELIESSSRQGEHVLDPFAGTCSTGVAAVLAGRTVTLIESDPRWIPLAIERLREADRLADAAESV